MRERDSPRPGRGVVHRGSDRHSWRHSEEKREIKREILGDEERSPDPPRKSERKLEIQGEEQRPRERDPPGGRHRRTKITRSPEGEIETWVSKK